ncbi:beta-hexosaminidase [Primorskyibacter aestuariivivens]|uniref:glycoside hydrolase family 3 N-terminal domain-containing protein n=1 Tax=Primorskyibacter aestuariivivens TaxID=1888912 RepID=UPI002301EBF0|nr:glycoside hydrolase family 3 N-terminal domain-containing protein [Primorskyibacter aestuariivivens]MDA7428917.1 beta-hexosaminidase [Primorskyibacter aestuariivivens]
MSHSAVIVAPAGTTLSPEERAFFAEAAPWGFILFTRNLTSHDQIRALCNDLRDAVGYDAPILIDQEGGRVQRLRPPLARDWNPPLKDVARLGKHAAKGMYLRARIIAWELLDLGIDVNCIPTLDVAGSDTHPFLRNRCYGETLEDVVSVGHAVAGGLLDGGVLPVIKHMPGHGRGRVDSHVELPHTKALVEELRASDFAAFAALSDMPLGMSAHMIFEDVDPYFPATQSERMIHLIRAELGFDGLLMTDDISMEALSGTVAERGLAAIRAGCDVVLHSNGRMDEMSALVEAVGTMSEDAALRGKAALAYRQTPAPVDISELAAQFEALLAGSGE